MRDDPVMLWCFKCDRVCNLNSKAWRRATEEEIRQQAESGEKKIKFLCADCFTLGNHGR